MENVELGYYIGGQLVADYSFTVPVEFEGYTSMPWTFIFPESSVKKNVNISSEQGKIQFL
jgi:SLAP domain-containing protein